MKINRFILFIFLVFLIIFLLKKEEKFQKKFASITLPIKKTYLEITNSIKGSINEHSNQVQTIQKLEDENVLLRKYLYQQKIDLITFKQLHHYNEKKFNNFENILRVQTISYQKLNDFSQIYLTQAEKLSEDKVYGLIQKNVVAGIAIKRDNMLKGLLLSNPTCQFSTFIGKKKTPGIAKGIDAETIEVRFIPKWSKIKVGDKVITSGLDNIFLAEIPVGTVTNILTKSTYKTAIVKTYADTLHPSFFYLVKKVLHKVEDINISKMKLENNLTKE